MPSTTLQSRISTFDSLGAASPSSSPPTVPRRTQVNRGLLETPLSPIIVSQPVAPYTPRQSASVSPSPSPPNLGRKTSLIDLKDWIVDDGPSPPRQKGFMPHFAEGNNSKDNGHFGSARTSTQQVYDLKKQLSEAAAPLINLESPPKVKQKPKQKPVSIAPPLPPRKPSYTSLKSVASYSSPLVGNKASSSLYPPRRSDSLTVEPLHTYPPAKLDMNSRSRNTSGHATASSISSFHSVSLSSDTDASTPGSVSNFIATFPMDRDRDGEFSVLTNGSEADSISLDESYENVSVTSLASPFTERMILLDWEKAIAKRKVVPPKLPQRPSSSASSSSAVKTPKQASPRRPPSTPTSPRIHPALSHADPGPTLPTTSTTRRPAPPPPSRSSDCSSIQSTATSRSAGSSSAHSQAQALTLSNNLHLKTRRPTPVPPAARRRYEGVFDANVLLRLRAEKQKLRGKPALLSPGEARKTRQAAGWRGLSVDLITGGVDPPVPAVSVEDEADDDDGLVGNDEKLDPSVIKSIWTRSGLDRRRLADIWNECADDGSGSLNRNAFVKGMWKIDEELRRAQLLAIKSASPTSLGSLRSRTGMVAGYRPSMPTPKPKVILR